MDYLIRSFFNNHLKDFFEPLSEEAISVSIADGCTFHSLKIRPNGINAFLQKNKIDFQVLYGNVENLKIQYTALSGTFTIGLDSINVKIRPLAARMVGKMLVNRISQFITSSSPYTASIPEEPYTSELVTPNNNVSSLSHPYNYDINNGKTFIYRVPRNTSPRLSPTQLYMNQELCKRKSCQYRNQKIDPKCPECQKALKNNKKQNNIDFNYR